MPEPLSGSTTSEQKEHLVVDEGGDLIEYAAATFNLARTHRYELVRVWGPDTPPVMFVMLNPSTADAFCCDSTITRCLRFARRENAGGMVVVNLFALRSTNPAALAGHPNPVGCSNNHVISSAVQGVAAVIAGWGRHGHLNGRDREVMQLLSRRGVELLCLGLNRDGSPAHPLYLRADQPLTPYPPSARD
ncbi:DUF1643 domain-containing protein [Lentzea sp. CA-135723]|uniref:DUF1643 domain-containing protein n=1 Tax=Lentzea sp. CA-135723 TaxID=3239950 RepID=UPI003D8E917E